MTTGMIQEVTNLYVKINDVKIRYGYLDGVDMTKVGDIVEYETEETESKTDPSMKITYLKPKSFRRADTPRAADAFVTGDKIVREDKAQGVVVTETVKKPVEPVKEPEDKPGIHFTQSGPIIPSRDVLIVRQTCLERACDIITKLPIVDEVGGKPKAITSRMVLSLAEDYEQWVLRK